MTAAAVLPGTSAMASQSFARRPITLGDRGVGLTQSPAVFAMAAGLGVAAVEIDLGRLGRGPDMPNRLLDAGVRYEMKVAAHAAGVGVSSFSLSALGEHGFAVDARAEAFADDLLFLMREFEVGAGYLPVQADTDYTRSLSIDKLRRLAERAERQDAVLAVDSPLSAAGLAAVLDAVGSSAVRGVVTLAAGRDAAADFALLGVDRVGQVRYRHGETDSATLAAFCRLLTDTGFDGLVVIDRVAAVSDEIGRNAKQAAADLARAFTPARS